MEPGIHELDSLFRSHNCRHLYFDVGTNIGVQIRKLYQPESYAALQHHNRGGVWGQRRRRAMLEMMGLMQKAFGPSPRCSVCAIGFEPNALHHGAISRTTSALGAVGFGVHVYEAAAALTDGWRNMTINRGAPLSAALGDDRNVEARHEPGADGYSWRVVRVRTISFPRLLRHALEHLDRVHGQTAAARKRGGKVVVKFDLEGSEYELLPGLMNEQLLCALHSGSVEWHPARRGLADEVRRRARIQIAVRKAALACGVDLQAIDDEYMAKPGDGPPYPNTSLCERASSASQAPAYASHPAAVARAEQLLVNGPAAHAAASVVFGTEPGFRVYLDDACAMPAGWWARAPSESPVNTSGVDFKYGADVLLPRILAGSPFVTADWRRASASLVVLHSRHFGGPVLGPERCRRALAARSAAWRATNGSRHFFVLPGDYGPCDYQGALVSLRLLRHHVIAIHGELEGHHWRHGVVPDLPCFYPYKDISIPPFVPMRESEGWMAGGKRDRDLLVFFAGGGMLRTHKRQGRTMMLRLWGNNSDPDIRAHRRLPREAMLEGFARARYCPIFGGNSPWSTRLVEAVYAGCVPVFFSSWLPPFSRILNWTRCSVRMQSLDQIADLKTILSAQPHEELAKNLRSVRAALWYRTSGRYQGDDMLAFLLMEMHLALKAAASRPLSLRKLARSPVP